MNKQTPGRRPNPPDERRTERVAVTMTQRERADIIRAADRDQVTASEYCRRAILNAVRGELEGKTP